MNTNNNTMIKRTRQGNIQYSITIHSIVRYFEHYIDGFGTPIYVPMTGEKLHLASKGLKHVRVVN